MGDLRSLPDSHTEAVTGHWAGAPHQTGWSRLSAGQKASVVGTGLLVVVLGIVVLIGAFGGKAGGSRPTDEPATAVSSIAPASGPG